MMSKRFYSSQNGRSASSSQVEALASVLEANAFSASSVAKYDAGQWHMVAVAAKVQDPDEVAKATVIRRLHEREQALAVQRTGSDREPSSLVFDRWLRAYRDGLESLRHKQGR